MFLIIKVYSESLWGVGRAECTFELAILWRGGPLCSWNPQE
jgi:hypothetical protein